MLIKSIERASRFLRILVPCLAAILISSCATDNGHAHYSHGGGGNKLSGWGRTFDPDGDCKFSVARDALTISVPGAAHAHDLAPEIGRTNAPRVLRKTKGDFTIEVRVDGRFAPGVESTQESRVAYNGAGLVAMADSQNVVTLARAALQNPGEGPAAYANFEMRVNGNLNRFGLTSDHPLPNTGAVFLRLQRRGLTMIGAVSLDGSHWDTVGSKEIPDNWSSELHSGIVAISTSAQEFDPQFSQFRIVR